MSKATQDALAALHGLLAEEMAKQIREGVVSVDNEGNQVKASTPAALLNVARAFLKDNAIEVDPGNPGDSVTDLTEALKDSSLPFPTGDGGEPRH